VAFLAGGTCALRPLTLPAPRYTQPLLFSLLVPSHATPIRRILRRGRRAAWRDAMTGGDSVSIRADRERAGRRDATSGRSTLGCAAYSLPPSASRFALPRLCTAYRARPPRLPFHALSARSVPISWRGHKTPVNLTLPYLQHGLDARKYLWPRRTWLRAMCGGSRGLFSVNCCVKL